MRIIIFIFILLVGSPILAQEVNHSDLPEKWTLSDCLEYALDNNITVKSAELSQDNSEINYKKAKASRLPDLTGSASQIFSNGNSIDPITSDYITEQISSTNVGLNTSISLFEGMQISNTIKQNALLLDQNSLYLEEARNDIRVSVLQAYLQVLYSKEGIRIAENDLEASESELERAQARLDAGSIPMKDYTDAQAQVATNKYSLIAAKNSYAQQILAIKQLLELQPSDGFEIIDLPNEEEVINLVPDKIDVFNKALDVMPEVEASKLSQSISEKDLAITKGAYLPSLTLTGSLGTGYTSSSTIDFSEQLDLNFNQRIGLQLNIPIFNRKQTKYQVQSAQIAVEETKLEQASVRKELYQKVETAWQNVLASQEQFIASKSSMDAAYESYQLAKKEYELGSLSTTDLVISQNAYSNAQQNYVQAKYMSILYYQLLQFYQGNEIQL